MLQSPAEFVGRVVKVNCTKHVEATDNWQAGGRHWRALGIGHDETVQDGNGAGEGWRGVKPSDGAARTQERSPVTVGGHRCLRARKGNLARSVVNDKHVRDRRSSKVAEDQRWGTAKNDPLVADREGRDSTSSSSMLTLFSLGALVVEQCIVGQWLKQWRDEARSRASSSFPFPIWGGISDAHLKWERDPPMA